MRKCLLCYGTKLVVVGGAVLEQSCLFYDVIECADCGGIFLSSPNQVIIGTILICSDVMLTPKKVIARERDLVLIDSVTMGGQL